MLETNSKTGNNGRKIACSPNANTKRMRRDEQLHVFKQYLFAGGSNPSIWISDLMAFI